MNYWVLKGRPDRNDWDKMLRKGGRAIWRTAKPPAKWQPFDRIFCWESSPAKRIVGLAELSRPLVRINEDGDTMFEVKYLTPPLQYKHGIEELRRIRILGEASFLKSGPATTVISITEKQANLLLRAIYSKNPGLHIVWHDVELVT